MYEGYINALDNGSVGCSPVPGWLDVDNLYSVFHEVPVMFIATRK